MSDSNEKERIHWNMHIQESFGTVFLGIVCIMLVVFLMKSEERNKALVLELLKSR
jgi:hypothetical protein